MTEYIRQGKTVRQLNQERPIDQWAWAQGWVRSIRQKKTFSFVVIDT